MELYEREYFVYRIAAGYLRYSPEDTVLLIHTPNQDILYAAQEVYIDFYKKALETGIMQDEDVYSLLIENNLWSEKEEEYLKNTEIGINHQIEEFKVRLYRAAFKSKDRQTLRKYLQVAKKEYHRLLTVRHSFDYATCEGVASFARLQYIIENSTTFEDKRKYDWSCTTPVDLMHHFQMNAISDDIMRELARTEPFSSIWQAGQNNGPIFSPPASALSLEQKRIIAWARMYDNIRESPDCPHNSIIDDDDMLDGWLIIQRREREKEQTKKQGDELITNPKIKNAEEIFLPAQSAEDAKKIDNLNDVSGQMIKKTREHALKQAGSLKLHELPDMKQRLKVAAAQEMQRRIKGK